MHGSGSRGWDRWTHLSGMSMSGQIIRGGEQKVAEAKGETCELASDVTCFLMRGHIEIKNLTV